MYLATGVFGAAAFGQHTEGNILVNDLLPQGAVRAAAALYGLSAGYLALGMTTTQYALRASLDLMFVGPDAPFTWRRQTLWTALTVGSSLAVALAVPDKAEKVYAFVGASAVCAVCYVVPVAVHLRLRGATHNSMTSPLLGPQEGLDGPEDVGRRIERYGAPSRTTSATELVREVGLPLVILALGVGFSIAALFVAVRPLLHPE